VKGGSSQIKEEALLENRVAVLDVVCSRDLSPNRCTTSGTRFNLLLFVLYIQQ